ncbi:MAG: beta-propeller fold lactonase family protein [Terracidiphilus sp.]
MIPRHAAIARVFAFSLIVLALAGCRSHDFPQYPANYREYVYVTNGGSGTVTVLDVVNVRLDRELPVGQNPVAAAASPTRNEVYVVNSGAPGGEGSISVINAENNTVAATIPLHRQPVAIDLDPEGKLAYIANSGSNSVSVVDLKSRREVAQIGAGEEPVAVRLSPDGKTLAVANRRGNSLSLIDPGSLSVRAVFAGCPGASDLAILPDSSKAFVACSVGHQIMSIALARAAQPATAQPGSAQLIPAQPDRLEALMDVGRGPVQVALKPDGGEIFVVNSLSNSISEVITGNNDVQGAYLMGDNPVSGLVSRDNALLYVGNLRSQTVIVYSINDGRRVAYIHVGDGPSALGFSAEGNLLFVVDARSGDVAVVRTAPLDGAITRNASLSVFTLLPTGRNPNAIADKAFKLP